ncbi:hypothetical protein H0H92_010154 [Tricholoma furcatifolium]|nr:hypothetical protein H0H92_010154 [Tricholoma furcatifolium]
MRLTGLFITLSIALSVLAVPLNDEATGSLVSRTQPEHDNQAPPPPKKRVRIIEPPKGSDIIGPPLPNGKYPPESLSKEYKDRNKLGAHLGNGNYLPRPPIGPDRDIRRRDLDSSADELLVSRTQPEHDNQAPPPPKKRVRIIEPPKGSDIIGPPLPNGKYPPESLSKEYKDRNKLGAHLGNGNYLPRPPIGPDRDIRRRDLDSSTNELLVLRDTFDELLVVRDHLLRRFDPSSSHVHQLESGSQRLTKRRTKW